VASPTSKATVWRSDPSISDSNIPPALRELLQELIALKLLEHSEVRSFLSGIGDRLPMLTSKERALQALVLAGKLTSYQRDRILAGNTFGLLLGHYRVIDTLGGGSVGIVFLAEHLRLRRRVAIKVVPMDEDYPANLRERFETEMRMLATLQHPHLVAVYDAGVLESVEAAVPSLHYLVLELVPGGDLEQHIMRHGLSSVAQACEWARQTAAGLQVAHNHHVVHRDLKPSNLLLTQNGQIKIVDFGLARQGLGKHTQPRSLLGSLEFMSPEQCLDPTNIGPAADVYALGACLFWTLTGHLPISAGRQLEETLQAIKNGQPRSLREFLPEVPTELDALMNRLLARDPALRPTALEAMLKLAEFAGEFNTEGELNRQALRQMEARLKAQEADADRAENAVISALTMMLQTHDQESRGHFRRMQEYTRLLVKSLASHPDWPELKDSQYVAELIRCVPLHDIGKIRLPASLLSKPGLLTPEERALVETHPQLACDVLAALAEEHGASLRFLGMARAIVRHHHERWDGNGYPDRFAGANIPAPARIVALASTYDDLRRSRPQRGAMTHAEAITQIVLQPNTFFDPNVLKAFLSNERRFDEVLMSIPE